MNAPDVPLTLRPRLVCHARLEWDAARETHVLLAPEGVLILNATSAAILSLCDGERSVGDIAGELRWRYKRVVQDEIRSFLGRLAARHLLELDHGG